MLECILSHKNVIIELYINPKSMIMNQVKRLIIGLFVLVFTISTAHSGEKKAIKTNNGSNPAGITYVIVIDDVNISGLCYSYLVKVTDDNGEVVADPIMFQAGINNYIFHESGPVSGSRIAKLEKISSSPKACNQILYTPPQVMTNNFRSGSTYIFNLSPKVIFQNN